MRAWRATMVVALGAEAVGGFLPWVRTGERERNAFELVDAARSLDALDSTLGRALAAAWYLVPLATALCWLGLLLDPRRPAGPLTVAAAALALATGLLGAFFALLLERGAIPVELGVHATLVAALAVVVGGAGVALRGLMEQRKAGRHELVPGPGRLAATADAAD